VMTRRRTALARSVGAVDHGAVTQLVTKLYLTLRLAPPDD